MKAALAKYRSKETKVSREEAKIKEAKWTQRHNDLEAKLHSLKKQQEDVDSDPAENVEDLQELLRLEQRKSKELETQIKALRTRSDHLERTNKSLTLLLVEKDSLVSRYLNEMLKLRSEIEQFGKGKQAREMLVHLDSALEDIHNGGEDEVLEEWTAAKTNAPVGKEALFKVQNKGNSFEFDESRISLQSWKQSNSSKKSPGKTEELLLSRTGTFGQDAEPGMTTLETEITRLREMLESAERELMLEKQERALVTGAKEQLERDQKELRDNLMAVKEQLVVLETKSKLPDSQSTEALKVQFARVQIELAEAKTLISTLQTEAERAQPDSFPTTQDPNTLQAIQQLSMIILSKEKSQMLDQQTKSLVKSVFGDNFSNLVSAYEQKVSKLEEELKDLKETRKSELEKHLAHLDNLQETIALLLDLNQLLEVEEFEDAKSLLTNNLQKYQEMRDEVEKAASEAQLLYEEMGVLSMRNYDYSSPDKKSSYLSANGELEQLRTKLSIQTSENVSLHQKMRQLQSKENETERLKKSLTEQKAEKRRLGTENEKLKQDMTQALVANGELARAIERLEFKVKTDLESEDFLTVIQCQASVFEDLLQAQQAHNEELEDFDTAELDV